jgi:selenocysteine lyase/cysteine desulfurase
MGMSAVARHEADLTSYVLEKLNALDEFEVYGDTDPSKAIDRLGVIPIQLKHVPHFLAAAILGYEFGIGVRSGCFYAHPHILHLLGLSNEKAAEVRRRMIEGDRSEMPGLIRASFGLYNTLQEVDILVDAFQCISVGEYKGKYTQDKASREYSSLDWQPKFSDFFSL